MRSRKVTQSKSKSQTCCYCGTQGHHFRKCSIFRRDVSSQTRHPGCLDSSCEWIGPGHWRHGHKPIASAPSVPMEAPAQNESAVPDVRLPHNDRNVRNRAVVATKKSCQSLDDTQFGPQSVTIDHPSTQQGRTKNPPIEPETLHSRVPLIQPLPAIPQSRQRSPFQPKTLTPEKPLAATPSSNILMNNTSHDDESCLAGSLPHSASTLAEAYPHNSTITRKRAMLQKPQEPLSEPEPYPDTPDIYISRDDTLHLWFIRNGSHYTAIPRFTDRDDPVMVAKYLASRANGPINVIWW